MSASRPQRPLPSRNGWTHSNALCNRASSLGKGRRAGRRHGRCGPGPSPLRRHPPNPRRSRTTPAATAAAAPHPPGPAAATAAGTCSSGNCSTSSRSPSRGVLTAPSVGPRPRQDRHHRSSPPATSIPTPPTIRPNVQPSPIRSGHLRLSTPHPRQAEDCPLATVASQQFNATKTVHGPPALKIGRSAVRPRPWPPVDQEALTTQTASSCLTLFDLGLAPRGRAASVLGLAPITWRAHLKCQTRRRRRRGSVP